MLTASRASSQMTAKPGEYRAQNRKLEKSQIEKDSIYLK